MPKTMSTIPRLIAGFEREKSLIDHIPCTHRNHPCFPWWKINQVHQKCDNASRYYKYVYAKLLDEVKRSSAMQNEASPTHNMGVDHDGDGDDTGTAGATAVYSSHKRKRAIGPSDTLPNKRLKMMESLKDDKSVKMDDDGNNQAQFSRPAKKTQLVEPPITVHVEVHKEEVDPPAAPGPTPKATPESPLLLMDKPYNHFSAYMSNGVPSITVKDLFVKPLGAVNDQIANYTDSEDLDFGGGGAYDEDDEVESIGETADIPDEAPPPTPSGSSSMPDSLDDRGSQWINGLRRSARLQPQLGSVYVNGLRRSARLQ